MALLDAAVGPYGDRVVVERAPWLRLELGQIARCAEHAFHAPVALRLILIRKVDAHNGGGEFVNADSLPESAYLG